MRRRLLALWILGACTGAPDPPEALRLRPPSDLLRDDGTLRGEGTWRDLGPVSGDRDADGLTDEEEALAGTDPDNPDSDGDALLDGWEVKGVDGTSLALLGADPLVRDLFVEMDYMERPGAPGLLPPTTSVLDAATSCFAAKGIRLHLILDAQVTYKDDLTVNDFYLLKGQHFDIEKRARCFHYMIWADRWEMIPGVGRITGQSMGIPDPDFAVTLGEFAAEDDAARIGTFLHELGHNLGLRHGGSDDATYKPNHLSVMNYLWQLQGLDRDGSFRHWDYQGGELPALDEHALNEPEGIGLTRAPAGFRVRWHFEGEEHFAPADGPIDWNGNLAQVGTLEASAGADINRDGRQDLLAATPDEWRSLQFRNRLVGQGLAPAAMQEEALRIPAKLPHETLDTSKANLLRKAMAFR